MSEKTKKRVNALLRAVTGIPGQANHPQGLVQLDNVL